MRLKNLSRMDTQPVPGQFRCLISRGLSIRAAASYLGQAKEEGAAGVLSGLTDGISRGVEGAGAVLSETFFDTTLRLGVTGLSRAGKTVFITALVANLLNRGRMPQLKAQAQGRIQAVYLQPQPDVTLPRFGDPPCCPDRRSAALACLDTGDLGTAAVVPGGTVGAVLVPVGTADASP